jgi:hypothetical protein
MIDQNKGSSSLFLIFVWLIILIFLCGCSATQLTPGKSHETGNKLQNESQQTHNSVLSDSSKKNGITCGNITCSSEVNGCCNGICYDPMKMSCIGGVLYSGKNRVTCGIHDKVCQEGFDCCGGECYNISTHTCYGFTKYEHLRVKGTILEKGTIICGGVFCPKGNYECCGGVCYNSRSYYCQRVSRTIS